MRLRKCPMVFNGLQLYVGNIGVPNELYQEKSLGIKPTNILRYSFMMRLF